MKNETKGNANLTKVFVGILAASFIGGVAAGRYSKKPAKKEEEETPPPNAPVVEEPLAEETSQKPARRNWKEWGLWGFLTVTALTVITLAASKEEGAEKRMPLMKAISGARTTLARKAAALALEDLMMYLPKKSGELKKEGTGNEETKSLMSYLHQHIIMLEACRIVTAKTSPAAVKKLVASYDQTNSLCDAFFEKRLTSEQLELALRKLAEIPRDLADKISTSAVVGELRNPDAYKKWLMEK